MFNNVDKDCIYRKLLYMYLECPVRIAISHVEMQILRYHTFDGISHGEYQLDAFVHLFYPFGNAGFAKISGCLLDCNLIAIRLWHLIAVISKAPTVLFIVVKEINLNGWCYNIRVCGGEEF